MLDNQDKDIDPIIAEGYTTLEKAYLILSDAFYNIPRKYEAKNSWIERSLDDISNALDKIELYLYDPRDPNNFSNEG